jgi:hypothetical protein
MSRTPLGAGDAIYCRSRDNGGEAAEGGAVLLMVRAACGETSNAHLAPFVPPQAARTYIRQKKSITKHLNKILLNDIR